MKSPMALIGAAEIVNNLQQLNSYEVLNNAEQRNDLVNKINTDSNRLIIQLNVKYGEMQLQNAAFISRKVLRFNRRKDLAEMNFCQEE